MPNATLELWYGITWETKSVSRWLRYSPTSEYQECKWIYLVLKNSLVIEISYSNYLDSSVCHSTIARVWRPPQATSLAIQRPSAPSPAFLGAGIFIGTSIGWPVVTFLPYPRRPWSPRPNCQYQNQPSRMIDYHVKTIIKSLIESEDLDFLLMWTLNRI